MESTIEEKLEFPRKISNDQDLYWEEFKKDYNPIFLFGRLKRIGFDKNYAEIIVNSYMTKFFNPLVNAYKNKIEGRR